MMKCAKIFLVLHRKRIHLMSVSPKKNSRLDQSNSSRDLGKPHPLASALNPSIGSFIPLSFVRAARSSLSPIFSSSPLFEGRIPGESYPPMRPSLLAVHSTAEEIEFPNELEVSCGPNRNTVSFLEKSVVMNHASTLVSREKEIYYVH